MNTSRSSPTFVTTVARRDAEHTPGGTDVPAQNDRQGRYRDTSCRSDIAVRMRQLIEVEFV
jgi:hypothetical protein